LKKYVWAIAILVATGIAILLLFFMNTTGEVSGTVRLFVDGEEMQIDGADVDILFTGNDSDVRMGTRLENGRFHFNRNEYGFLTVRFILNQSIWGESERAISFRVSYFNTYHRAITEFNIQVNVMTEEGMVEMIAGVGTAYESSGKMPIESGGMKIFVSIPGP